MPENLLLCLHDSVVFQPYVIEERFLIGDEDHRGTHHFRVIHIDNGRRRIDDFLSLNMAIEAVRGLQAEILEIGQ